MTQIMVGKPLVSIGAMKDGTLSPEQYATVAVHKILYVSNNAHPLIREQANAYKERMHTILGELFQKAMADERARLTKGL